MESVHLSSWRAVGRFTILWSCILQVLEKKETTKESTAQNIFGVNEIPTMTSTTLRLTGIPRTTTKRGLSKAAGVSTDCVSLAPTDSSKDSVSTATITFESKRAADKFKSAQKNKPAKCLGKRPNIDDDLMGLTVLSSSGAQDEVE